MTLASGGSPMFPHVVHQPDNVIDVVNELYKRTNYLLSDFSFTESYTVSNLFNSFCMNYI